MSRGSVETQCQQCSVPFLTFPYLLKQGNGKYCGSRCYGEAKKGFNPTKKQLNALEKGRGWNKGKAGLSNENHPAWKGDKVSYASLHAWLKRNFGTPTHCENKACTGRSKTFHYAKLKDKEYSRNREDYVWLCASCHTKYDSYELKLSL